MRFIYQGDHSHMLYVTRCELDEKNRERGKTTTIKSSGCGLCAAIMAVDRLLPNCNFELTDAIQLSYDSKANLDIGTDYAVYGPAVAEKFGLRYEVCADVEGVRNCLRTGGAVVVLVGGDKNGHKGLFCASGHYMTIISEEPDGRLAVLDPAFSVRKFKENGKEEIRSQYIEIKNDVVNICDADALHGETTGKYGPYHLYWRA